MEKDFEIKRYTPEHKKIWDNFVESSKNGTFLFNRDYMDYHCDRFQDNSYIFYHKNRVYCLLPANRKDDILFSHEGLTYGGVIMDESCTAQGILEVFNLLTEYLMKEGIKRIIYKPVPHIYHSLPAEEDLYALFRHDASLRGRNISATIFQRNTIKFSTLRKRMIKKAVDYGIKVHPTNDWNIYWDILTKNLREKYDSSPVHSRDEILKLSSSFPHHIKLYGAFKNERMIGGVVVYLFKEVAHTQYISANKEGKENGAIDIILDHLIKKYEELPYFDLGTSNEDGGKYLNENLIHQKEGFGARGICYDTWEMIIS